MMMQTISRPQTTQKIQALAAELTRQQCLDGIPLHCAKRFLGEIGSKSSPSMEANLLMATFWANNPRGHEPGEHPKARICSRTEAIARCLKWYQLEGGTDSDWMLSSLLRSAPEECKGDGLAKHDGELFAI